MRARQRIGQIPKRFMCLRKIEKSMRFTEAISNFACYRNRLL